MTKPVECPYCGGKACLVTGKVIYPRRQTVWKKSFWSCAPCDAYVGCHGGITRPLGSLANSPLRSARIKAHAAFDGLWRTGPMRRVDAYKWLATKLGIELKHCHIGMFDETLCRIVVAECSILRKRA